MYELKIFANSEFGEIRTVTDRVNSVWFCGSDVAKALGYERGAKEAGVIVVSKDGNLIEREGCFVLDSETLVGGWARVHIKGRNPEYQSVAFNEYAGRKKDGTLNSQWAGKPATMIRKVAVVQALREAFPETFQGLYAQEEMAEASDVQLDAQEIVAKEIVESANSVEFEESATNDEKEILHDRSL